MDTKPMTPAQQADAIESGTDLQFIINHAIDNNFPAVQQNMATLGISAPDQITAAALAGKIYETYGADGLVYVYGVDYVDDQTNGTGGINSTPNKAAKGKIKNFLQNYGPKILNALGGAVGAAVNLVAPGAGTGVGNAIHNVANNWQTNLDKKKAEAAAAAAAQAAAEGKDAAQQQAAADAAAAALQAQADAAAAAARNATPPPPEEGMPAWAWFAIGGGGLLIIIIIIVLATRKKTNT